MEGSAMSTSPAVTRNCACRGGLSAPEQGAISGKKFVPAGTELHIPLFPPIPRNKHLDPAGSGNVGKEGKPSAASGTVHSDLRQALVSLGALRS
jgi:hypothetical protein